MSISQNTDGPYPHSRTSRDMRKLHMRYLVEQRRAAQAGDRGAELDALGRLLDARIDYAHERFGIQGPGHPVAGGDVPMEGVAQ